MYWATNSNIEVDWIIYYLSYKNWITNSYIDVDKMFDYLPR